MSEEEHMPMADEYCWAVSPLHNDGECCWCDLLRQLEDEGYFHD